MPHHQRRCLDVVAISGHAKVSKSGLAALGLSCAGGSGSTCVGSLTLTSTVKMKIKRRVKGRVREVTETKTIGLGSARYSLAANTSETLRIALSKAGAKLLRHAPSHKLKAKAVAKPQAGTTTTKTVELN